MIDYLRSPVERFIFHHPRIYRQSLIVCLLLMTVGGLHSLFAESSSSTRPSIFTPPEPTVRETPAKRVVSTTKTQTASTSSTQGSSRQLPKGWENAERLPGRDGSTPVTQLSTARVSAPSIPLGSGDVRGLGRSLNAVEFGDQHWPALLALWNRESGWNPNARNSSSGACGIPQALPCSKIPDMSPQGQIEWGLQYIRSRYGNPSNAWSFWLKHHWY